MVVAQAAAIGVKGQLAHARNQIAIGHKAPACAFCAKAQVFQLHEHRDGEAVVNGRVLNVCGREAGFFKGCFARPCSG